jgi:hyaluronoglucosaminidase
MHALSTPIPPERLVEQPSSEPVDLGIVEGYFGRPWSWAEREATMVFLAGAGYRFFLYAPKADVHLRRRWREPHPDAELSALRRFAERCHAHGVRFGVGLSPFEAWRDFGSETRQALATRLRELDALGLDLLALLFDDMRGDSPELAVRQAEMVGFAAAHTHATQVWMCPTYYADAPVLDLVFGARPANYLATLGRRLDPAVGVLWTGEEVCSREYGRSHLERVASALGRPPVLWDNYPVNDGERMSRHLHLRGFTGRAALTKDLIAAHAINPALQPVLTRVPALTLAAQRRLGPRYDYGAATREALAQVLGEHLGRRVHEDLLVLQDIGLDRLGDRAAPLRERYAAESHPGAREIVDWLDGAYAVGAAEVQTQ